MENQSPSTVSNPLAGVENPALEPAPAPAPAPAPNPAPNPAPTSVPSLALAPDFGAQKSRKTKNAKEKSSKKSRDRERDRGRDRDRKSRKSRSERDRVSKKRRKRSSRRESLDSDGDESGSSDSRGQLTEAAFDSSSSSSESRTSSSSSSDSSDSESSHDSSSHRKKEKRRRLDKKIQQHIGNLISKFTMPAGPKRPEQDFALLQQQQQYLHHPHQQQPVRPVAVYSQVRPAVTHPHGYISSARALWPEGKALKKVQPAPVTSATSSVASSLDPKPDPKGRSSGAKSRPAASTVGFVRREKPLAKNPLHFRAALHYRLAYVTHVLETAKAEIKGPSKRSKGVPDHEQN